MKTESAGSNQTTHQIRLREALKVWFRVAALSFGGPAGQIAVMHRILVEEKQWISEERFLHALNYCMLLPGPEAQQLATYIGWLLHRTLGGLIAGSLFVLPGFLSILALSLIYAVYQDAPAVSAVFFGLKAAVLAVVVEAVVRIGRRVLTNGWMRGIALVAFVGIFFLRMPFPLIVAGAGLLGLIGGWRRPDIFCVIQTHSSNANQPDADTQMLGAADAAATSRRPSLAHSLITACIWLTIWLGPLIAITASLGRDHVFAKIGWFFSRAAVVTFGGAYSVLAYIAQRAVETYGWLRPGEMLDGLAMAETTPGPLIQVVQFVGYMGAYRQADMHPVLAGVLGSILTTHVTFAPCFLWIFVGAPYVEYIRGRRVLAAGLSCITAAVAGVVLNLALWFALHALFGQVHEQTYGVVRLLVPEPATFQWPAAVIAMLAAVALLKFHAGLIPTLIGGVLIGAGVKLVTG